MDDKRALLSELKIDPEQRESRSSMPRIIVTGIGALFLAIVGWVLMVPDVAPVAVNTSIALAATDKLSGQTSAVLEASGYVTARRQATVSSKFTAKVTDVLVEEGDVVVIDQLLATLDNSTQQAQYNLALAQLKANESRILEVDVQRQQAQLDYKRTIELAAKNLASTAELDRSRLGVEALKARLISLNSEVAVSQSNLAVQSQFLQDMEIRAPFAGVVIAKSAQPGEMISPVSAGGGFTRTGICTIVDMDSLEIEVDVNESYINRVKSNQPVTAVLNSYQDWQIPAKVITIIPTADRNKATVRVRIAFLETDSRILPDMGVKVSFLELTQPVAGGVDSKMDGVLIPANAITTIDEQPVVFVVDRQDSVETRSVTVGKRQGNRRNVTAGLSRGEKVVVDLNDELVLALANGQLIVTQ